MISTGTQRVMILEWMLDGHRITSLEALHRFRCMRLGARIHELKKLGYQIESRFIEIQDRETGKTKRVKEYWVEEGEENENA